MSISQYIDIKLTKAYADPKLLQHNGTISYKKITNTIELPLKIKLVRLVSTEIGMWPTQNLYQFPF